MAQGNPFQSILTTSAALAALTLASPWAWSAPKSRKPGKPVKRVKPLVSPVLQPVWRRTLPDQGDPLAVHGPANGIVVTVSRKKDSQGTISAFFADSGKLAWSRTDLNIYETLHVHGGRLLQAQYMKSSPGLHLVALDLATGKKVWAAPMSRTMDGLVVGDGRCTWTGPDDRIRIAKVTNGAAPRVLSLARGTEPYFLKSGSTYFSSGYGEGLSIVEVAADGAIRPPVFFSEAQASDYRTSGIYVLGNPRLYIGSESVIGMGFEYYSVRAVTQAGKMKWSTPDMVVASHSGNTLAANWIKSGNNGKYGPMGVAALDLATGKVLWKRADNSVSILGFQRGRIILFDGSTVLAVDGRSGRALWSRTVSGRVARLNGNRLYTFESASGPRLMSVRCYHLPT